MLVVVYRHGAGVQADLVSPDVAGGTMLRENPTLLMSNRDYQYSGTKSIVIEGSLGQKNLGIRFSGIAELRFALVPDGHAFRWQADEGMRIPNAAK